MKTKRRKLPGKKKLLKIIDAFERMHFRGLPIIKEPTPRLREAYTEAGLEDRFYIKRTSA